MQIEKKYSYSTLPAFTATSCGTTVAQEHVSLFPTQMALARWTRGGDVPHVHASERNMPMRAAWYAQAQRHFLSWLEAGGFHQTGHFCLDCARREETFPAPGIGSWPAPENEQ